MLLCEAYAPVVQWIEHRTSKPIMWVQFLPGAPKDTSRAESAEEPRAAGAREGRKPRRVATKWLGEGTEKWADLLRTAWFVPIFWTKSAISEKLLDEDKKAACFVSKTHSHKGSTSPSFAPCRGSRIQNYGNSIHTHTSQAPRTGYSHSFPLPARCCLCSLGNLVCIKATLT